MSLRSHLLRSHHPKALLRRFVIYVSVAVVLAVLLTAINFIRIDALDLRRGLREESARAHAVADALSASSPEDLHAGLNHLPDDSPYQGVFRFDTRATEAEFISDTEGGDPAERAGPLLEINFDGRDAATLGDLHGAFSLEEGLLKGESAPTRYLQIRPDTPINWSRVAAVEIRIKAHKEGKVSLLMGKESDGAPGKSDLEGRNSLSRFGKIDHELLPDGRFHDIRIEAASAVETFTLGPGSRITKLFLIPSTAVDDLIEIESIRLISRESRYRQQTHGSAVEKFGGERREVLFTQSPGTLRFFGVEIPEVEPRLRFGLARFNASAPVEVSVALEADERRQEVFSRSLDDENGWLDFDLELSAWAGKTVTFAFNVRGGENVVFWSNPLLAGRPGKRMNVIVVLEDTLRADQLDSYGGPGALTPEKAAWAKKDAVVFSHGFSPSTRTRLSCPSLMTSVYPSTTGVWKATDVLSPGFVTLPEVLRSRGFATASFVQNPNAGASAGLQQGFGSYFDWNTIGHRAETLYGPELNDWLDRHEDQNFFLYLHLIDPHFPYEPPDPFHKEAERKRRELEAAQDEALLERTGPLSILSNATDRERSFSLRIPMYHGEIAYNDRHFGRFLDNLEARGLMDNTLLLFVSDHGEYFGEHGGLEFHPPPTHTQVIHIPFMLSYPDVLEGGRTIDATVNLLDVMPTILDYADIRESGVPMQGRSLAPLIRGEAPDLWNRRPVFADEVTYLRRGDRMGWGSILFRDWHWIDSRIFHTPWNKFLPRPLLIRGYNRKSDPGEENHWNPLFFDAPFKLWLSGYLLEIQEENQRAWRAVTRGTVAKADYDEETLQHLRDLGYLN